MKLRPRVLIFGFFIHILMKCDATSCHFVDTDLPTLHTYLADSHHTPLCVLIRKTVSSLEKSLVRLKADSKLSLTTWRFAAVNTSQVQQLPQYLTQDSGADHMPHLRCFLGPLVPFDYEQPQHTSKEHLRQWLTQLVKKHQQLNAVDVATVTASSKRHHFSLVVFPTADQHIQLEEAAFRLGHAISQETSVEIIIVHPSASNFRQITQEFQVTNLPAVLLLENDSGSEVQQTLFTVHDLYTNKLETYMRAQLIPAVHLTEDTFESEVLQVKTSSLYRPYVVGFYAWWEKDVSAFLSFLRLAVLEFREMEANIRFGLVDVASNPAVLPQFMSADCVQHLPFIALFQRVQGTSTVKQSELLLKRPSTFSLFSALQQEGLMLTDRQRKAISFSPYGYTDPVQICMLWEGPQGYACSASTNISYSEEVSEKSHKTAEQELLNLPQSEKIGNITVLTADDWSSVVHVTSVQNDSTTSAPSSVHLTVVIFIRYQCRSCEQNLPTFQLLREQLDDSVSLFLVNCSQESNLCEQNHVSGFPTILAFRTYIPTPSASACSGFETPNIRQDYHGVLTVSAILQWVKMVSRNAVKHLQFQKPKWEGKESTRLLARVLPRDSTYLPLPPGKNKGYFYSTDCLQVLCERLFGLAQCFTIYSRDIPAKEYGPKNLTLVVAKVVFQRQDGVSVTVMELGKSLAGLLEAETSDALHMFHHPHSYKLKPTQKCEEEHSLCTRFLEDFTRDHLRLPVTHLTSELLHGQKNPLPSEKRPILLALAEPDNLTTDSLFLKVLEQVAVTLYKEVVVATLDVSMFQAWAGTFVPLNYNKQQAVLDSWGELGIYPRFCMFFWEDHTHAAFYPSASSARESPLSSSLLSSSPDITESFETSSSPESVESSPSRDTQLTAQAIVKFARNFLQDPSKYLVPTERF